MAKGRDGGTQIRVPVKQRDCYSLNLKQLSCRSQPHRGGRETKDKGQGSVLSFAAVGK